MEAFVPPFLFFNKKWQKLPKVAAKFAANPVERIKETFFYT
jgi:hypothetical protein